VLNPLNFALKLKLSFKLWVFLLTRQSVSCNFRFYLPISQWTLEKPYNFFCSFITPPLISYRLQYWSRERCVVWRVATSHHWRINVQSWNLCVTNVPWLEGDVATEKNTGVHHSAFSMWKKKKKTSNPMPRKAIQAHLQIPYRKINYFNGTLTNLKWTCGSIKNKAFAISDSIHPVRSAGSVNL